MKNLLTFDEFVNESYELNEKALVVSNKDWDRMLDLVVKGDTDASKVAKVIKDKNKAVARFVAGLKLSNNPIKYEDSRYSPYGMSWFSDLGNLAIELGASSQEIQDLYDSTEVPGSYVEKMTKLSGKKLNNRFVGDISKAILDAGFDINYLPHNGNAITNEGRYAMQRSGRKWTIGYKAEISKGSEKMNFFFDAITDEGGGSTYYVIDYASDEKIRRGFDTKPSYGKRDFIDILKKSLNNI